VFSWFSSQKRASKPANGGQRKLYIPESLYKKMISHCQEERPLEACGILTGEGGHVLAAYGTDNQHRSPRIYQVDERQLVQVFKELQRDKQDLIAIYHSHVQTEPFPSRTDIEQVTWPEAFYVIVSLATERPQVRAWRIVDRHVTEHAIIVQPDTPGAWYDLRRAVQASELDRRTDIQ
jgi:[CysO sulfur-carrier protein]-S-L-cysteine hydrolase